MRKLIAILFLTVLAINWLGYDLIVGIIQSTENKSFYSKIEAGEYKKDHLYEIKVDLQLPYATDWAEFEKIKGTVVVGGVVYNFVERKYENGFMIYKCLPNQRGTELQNARDYFQSLVYDLEKQEKKEDAPKSAAAKKLNIETTILALQSHQFLSTTHLKAFYSFLSADRLDGFGSIPSQPPEA
jgi:hypothetical protein